MNIKDAEYYWNKFLKSGKVEDFLNYRKLADFKETKTDLEIGKIADIKEVSNARKNRVYRDSNQKS